MAALLAREDNAATRRHLDNSDYTTSASLRWCVEFGQEVTVDRTELAGTVREFGHPIPNPQQRPRTDLATQPTVEEVP